MQFRTRSRSRRQAIRLLAVVAGMSLFAAACGSGDDVSTGGDGTTTDPARADATPTPGGSITFGLEAETNTWLPGATTPSNSGVLVQQALFDPLGALDADGMVQPYLAESITPNDALTEWTVKLRPGVVFHDGTPLDSEAMRYNFEELLTIESANTRATLLDTNKVVEFRVDDDLTFTYVLADGNAAFADVLTGTIGMPFSPAAHREFGEDAGSNPIGTGPFRFVDWRRDDRLVVQRWEQYWGKDADGQALPYLDEIVFRALPNEDTRLQTLLSGDIDAMHTLRQSIVNQLREGAERGTLMTYEHIGNNAGGAILNTAKAPVDDVRIRRAMAYALNQEELIDVLGGAGISPAQTQFFSEDSPWHSEKVADMWPTNDPDKAKELLGDYVSDPARSDGQAAGTPVTIDFNCPPDASLIELSQVYQHFWQAVGFKVNLNQVEQAAHIQNALTDNYTVNCWRMGGTGDPYSTLAVAFGDPETQALNFTNFSDPTMTEQLDVLKSTADLDARKDAVEQIMIRLAEEVPVTWTGSTATAIGAKPEVRNIDGWKFPEGSDGDGVTQGVTFLSWVWLEQ